MVEALNHAGYAQNAYIRIHWIDSESITKENVAQIFQGIQGIIVPGGFGNRGIEGMITAAEYARERQIPYFGICLGMQIAVIEYARHRAGLPEAHSGEFDEQCKDKVIDFMPGQSDDIDKGGTLRLGSYPCVLAEGSRSYELFGKKEIQERHRHRYEVNNAFREELAAKGMTIAGTSPDGHIVEMIEIKDHPFYEQAQAAYRFLSEATDAKGRKLKVHKLCLTKKPCLLEGADTIDAVEGTIPREDGEVSIASYMNFLIVNGAVILPQYGDENDAVAIEQVQKMFPDREVVGVQTKEVAFGGGNIHCITQQQPRP